MKLLNKFLSDVPKNARENFLRDCFGNTCSGIQTALFCNFFAIVAKKYLGASALEISIMTSVAFISGLVSVIITSFVPAGKEHKYMALMGTVSNVFLICVIPFIHTSLSFTVSYVIFYLIASYGPLYMIVLGKMYPIECRSVLMGRAKCFMAVASIIFSLVGGYAINKEFCAFPSWKIVFILAALVYLGNFLVCFNKLKLPPVNVERENPLKFLKKSFSLLKTDKKNTWLIGSGFFFTISFVILNTLIPIYQNDVLGIGPKEVGILLFLQNVSWAVSYPIFGQFISKYGSVSGWVLTCILGAFLPLGYIIIKGSWMLLGIFYLFYGVFMAGNDIAWANILLYVTHGKNVSEYQSLHYFFIAMRGIAGFILSSWLIGYAQKISLDLRWIFAFSILVILMSAFIVFVVFRKKN